MAQIDISRLFPKAQSRPITVRELFPYVCKIRSYGQSYKIKYLNADRPHPTLQKDYAQKPTRWFVDNKDHRPTTNQLSIISSFGRNFIFAGNDNDAWQRIGNSVPPLFMHAIATQIRHILWQGEPLENSRMTTDYPAHLELMWQKHLAPRADNAPTVISTFAGGGGSSLGYSMAGYRELLAVEWDNNAVETFRLNFPEVPVYHGDIAKLSVDECLKLAGIGPGELDILDGSPPCQGFSTAGKRVLDDPRNSLFKEYVRLLRGLRPKVFVMENVSGMVKGKMKLVFAEIMRELKASGYTVSARLLNAMYFHVPQSRERMIFIGVRDDLGIEPSHPKAESKPIGVSQCYYKNGDEYLSGAELERWQNIPPGGNWQNLPKYLINGKAKFSNFHRKLHPYKPSFTVGKEENYSSGRFYHWSEPRRINDIELSRIGSYPDKFKFIGGGHMVHNRIGNSVPPLFMEAIARNIRQNILEQQPVKL